MKRLCFPFPLSQHYIHISLSLYIGVERVRPYGQLSIIIANGEEHRMKNRKWQTICQAQSAPQQTWSRQANLMLMWVGKWWEMPSCKIQSWLMTFLQDAGTTPESFTNNWDWQLKSELNVLVLKIRAKRYVLWFA